MQGTICLLMVDVNVYNQPELSGKAPAPCPVLTAKIILIIPPLLNCKKKGAQM